MDVPAQAPLRFWWLKRLAVVYAVVLVALVVTHIWWGHAAQKRMDALVAEIRGRGEPLLIEDFVEAPVPDAANAAAWLKQAAGAIVPTTRQSVLDSWEDGLPIRPRVRAVLEEVAAANQQPVQLVREARKHPQANWNIALTHPVINSLLLDFTPQRKLAVLLEQLALYQHEQGDDAEAMELVRDTLTVGRAMTRYPPTLVSHLVAIGMSALSADLVQKIAPELQIEGGSPATRPTTRATRRQVEQVIAELLDESHLVQSAQRCWQGERMMQVDTCKLISRQGMGAVTVGAPTGGTINRWLVRPLLQMDICRMLRNTTAAERAATMDNWPAAKAALPKDHEIWWGPPLGTVRMLSSILTPVYGSATDRHFRALADRRMAAMAMAIRLYQIDHDGQMPVDLKALVPRYLPAIPADPYAADGRPIGYRLDPERPVLYSVGSNGTDEKGSELPNVRAPSGWMGRSVNRWEREDIVFHLRRAVAPSEETENDEKDVMEDEDGQADDKSGQQNPDEGPGDDQQEHPPLGTVGGAAEEDGRQDPDQDDAGK